MISNLLKLKRNQQILAGGGTSVAMPLSSRYARFGGFFRFEAGNRLRMNGQKMLHSLQHWLILICNTPAMPLEEAHFGGFFYARRKRA